MGTLPTTGENLDLIGFELEEQPSYTHKLDIEGQRVAGMTCLLYTSPSPRDCS